jgi:hypothetical protein
MFDCPPNPDVINFIYNIPYGFYDEIYVFFERGFAKNGVNNLIKVLGGFGIKKVTLLFCSGNLY